MAKQRYYTNEKNILILLSLLKQHSIKKVVASPGTTNHTFVYSMQNDPWFEMYSCVDERSAAYMGCGLAAESGEPVVITCTEATAARNYMPGLTEAYYRKLPVLAVTTTHGADKVGQLVAQVLDHSVLPNDVALKNYYIPQCHNAKEEATVALKINDAILELNHRGGGPVNLCVESIASRDYSVKELPAVRKIERFTYFDRLPELPQGRIGIFVGSHKIWTADEASALDTFCAVNNAVVFCDHTSGYHGKYRVDYSLICSQDKYLSPLLSCRLIIHIGNVSGDYFSMGAGGRAQEVWRVCEDGKLVDTWHKLHYVFEMKEQTFFSHYSKGKQPVSNHNIKKYHEEESEAVSLMPTDMPFTKVWAVSQIVPNLPSGSYVHFSILGSLRAGNFFKLPENVEGNCNVGGFGIDGATSTLLGASLAHKDRLHFLITGDLAFFYDLNAIGNRNLGNNVRIMLINNGDGTEFRMYWHPCSAFDKETCDQYMSAGGHYGHQSKSFMKHMAEDLGFEYLSATNKEEFNNAKSRFLTQELTERPLLLEIFTNSEVDNQAVYTMRNLLKGGDKGGLKDTVKEVAKSLLGEGGIETVKKILKK